MRNGGRGRAPVLLFGCFLYAARAWCMTPACVRRHEAPPVSVNKRIATRLLLSGPQPAYPPLARVNYIHGDVSLLLTVDCAGRVQRVHVLHGHPFLAMAALKAIKSWIYRPFMTRAGPAAFQTMVDVNFALLTRNLRQLPPNPEKFLARGVRPPRLPRGVKNATSQDAVQMRVLVNAQGHVVDSTLLSGNAAHFKTAERVVSHWRFTPARWGTLDVPWYMEVTVPVGDSTSQLVGRRAAANDRAEARPRD